MEGINVLELLLRPDISICRESRRKMNKTSYNEYPEGTVLELSDDDDDEIKMYNAHTVKNAVAEGRLRGLVLPGGTKQHCINQYADDSSFMVSGEKRYIDEMVKILQVFSAASGMEINWEKSSAYWFDRFTHKLAWLNEYQWQWATE